jgi:hypothetical protein
MKLIVFALVFSSAFLGRAQEESKEGTPPPPELKMADFLLGEWTNSESGEVARKKVDVTFQLSISKALGGHYLLVRHVHNVPGGADVEGIHMLTYDPDKKLWRAWWFISSEATVNELSGNFEGDKLMMVSKPFQTPGVTGDLVLRATWQQTADKGLRFTLDLKQADSWRKFIDRTYVKE